MKHTGRFIKKFPTNYVVLEVTHNIGAFTFNNEFDIPQHLLKKI